MGTKKKMSDGGSCISERPCRPVPEAQVHISPRAVAGMCVVTGDAQQECYAAQCALLVARAPQHIGSPIHGERGHEPTGLVPHLMPSLIVCITAGLGSFVTAIVA